MDQCEQNIAVEGRNRRFRLGLVFFCLGLLLTVLLFQSGAHPAWRATVFAPFALAGVLVFQAMYKTCVVRAMRGERETERGVEQVASASQRQVDQLRARLVFRSAAVSALLATGLLFLLP